MVGGWVRWVGCGGNGGWWWGILFLKIKTFKRKTSFSFVSLSISSFKKLVSLVSHNKVSAGALLYLKLGERRGSRIATNRGAGGVALAGSYARAVKLEATGPIANDDQNRAARFARPLPPFLFVSLTLCLFVSVCLSH